MFLSGHQGQINVKGNQIQENTGPPQRGSSTVYGGGASFLGNHGDQSGEAVG